MAKMSDVLAKKKLLLMFLYFFLTAAHFYLAMAARTSHFLTAAIISMLFYQLKFVCFVFHLSL